MTFTIIPVVDLRGGRAVHARSGAGRSGYRPLDTPLCPQPDPVTAAGALTRTARSATLYLADLDAICGSGDNAAAVTAIAGRHPQLELWVDAGIDSPRSLSGFRERCPGAVPVVGSESAGDPAWLLDAADFILSLDFGAAGFVGDPRLLDRAELWPARVIVMSMSRVGMDGGPDLERLRRVRRRRPNVDYYAAGGVRAPEDLERLEQLGARGALVATALHQGRL